MEMQLTVMHEQVLFPGLEATKEKKKKKMNKSIEEYNIVPSIWGLTFPLQEEGRGKKEGKKYTQSELVSVDRRSHTCKVQN